MILAESLSAEETSVSLCNTERIPLIAHPHSCNKRLKAPLQKEGGRTITVYRHPSICDNSRVTESPQTKNLVASDDATLRSDVRRLGDLLGQSLVRQEGQDLLDLVESVRKGVREGGGIEILEKLSVDESVQLVRAFSTYFHLANVAEQVHRSRVLAEVRAQGRAQLQKKPHTPVSRSDLTWPAAAANGAHGKPPSTRIVWCSSTRPGSRPTWHRCAAGAGAANA